ncbi:MAG: hypothetical protein NKF70_10020 [Methanobacterium sp. ERen5]|nr:MAG: hypothetical protein NKF70_10020 [Methanobacterium sp. ERen5]
MADHEDLKVKYQASKKELGELKSTDSNTKSGQGLFGRFLKRNDTDKSHEDSRKESKK